MGEQPLELGESSPLGGSAFAPGYGIPVFHAADANKGHSRATVSHSQTTAALAQPSDRRHLARIPLGYP